MEKDIEKFKNINVLKLAYIGDTVFDLFTRNYLIKKYEDSIKMNELHKKNSSLVCAKSQARIVEYLINENFLLENELELYKHARNSHPHSKSKNSSIVDYRKATGLEALLGSVYLEGDMKRLSIIFEKIKIFIDGISNK